MHIQCITIDAISQYCYQVKINNYKIYPVKIYPKSSKIVVAKRWQLVDFFFVDIVQ